MKPQDLRARLRGLLCQMMACVLDEAEPLGR
jgi:hypothetical protein